MPRKPRRFVRAHAVERMRQKLLQQSFPRLQMVLMVLLTGGCGLLVSYLLLHQGMGSMALRYPLALGVAYLFFLFLVWLWLRTNADDYWDGGWSLPDAGGGGSGGGGVSGGLRSGGGGDFAGAGATGDFSAPAPLPVRATAWTGQTSSDSGASSALDAVGSVGDADEFAIPLLVIALAVVLACASLYIIYIAPMLFAEVLVDGALSYGLFRHLRGQDPVHWLASTVRRTIVPFGITALFLAGMGAAMSAYAPAAQTLGQFMQQAGQSAQ